MRQRPRGNAPSGWSADDLGPGQDDRRAPAPPEPPERGFWLVDDLVEGSGSGPEGGPDRALSARDRTDLWRFEPAAPPEIDLSMFKPVAERIERMESAAGSGAGSGAGAASAADAGGATSGPALPRRADVRQPKREIPTDAPVSSVPRPRHAGSVPTAEVSESPVAAAAAAAAGEAAAVPAVPAETADELPVFAPTAFPFRRTEPEADEELEPMPVFPSRAESRPPVPEQRVAEPEESEPEESEPDVHDLVAEAFGRPEPKRASGAPAATSAPAPAPEPEPKPFPRRAARVAGTPSPEPESSLPSAAPTARSVFESAAPASPAPASAAPEPEPSLWRADHGPAGSSSSGPATASWPAASPVAKPTSPASASARRTYGRAPEPTVDPAPEPAPAPASAPRPQPIQPLIGSAPPRFPARLDGPALARPFAAAPDDLPPAAEPSAADPSAPAPPAAALRPVSAKPAVERPDLAWPEFSWPEAAADSRGPFEPKLSGPKASSRLRFEPGRETSADPFAGPAAAPQQVPVPEPAAEEGWLDTIHWQEQTDADGNPSDPHARRPGIPFRRRKGGAG